MKKRNSRRALIGLTMAVSAGGLAARGASAQRDGRTVTGQVVDASTHDVLDGVRVTVKGTDLQGRTANDGSFFIDKVPGEKVALVVSRAGYKSREVDILVGSSPTTWTVALWKKGT